MARHNRKHDRRKRQMSDAEKARIPVNPAMQAQYLRKIRSILHDQPDKRILQTALPKRCHARRAVSSYQAAVAQALREGIICEKGHWYILREDESCFKAEVIRLAGNFGFIRDEEGTEYFVPGKLLSGSMAGDKVVARPLPPREGEGAPEAEVISITEEAEARLSGMIVPTEEGLCLLPDGMNFCLHINYRESVPYKIGDKVLCALVSRGRRHSEHRVKVLLNYGNADNAEACMAARIEAQNIPTVFSSEVLHEAEKLRSEGVTAFDHEGRLDLREALIFTIDGAHSKDLDDAVSVEKHPDGSYTLGVHIADVSHYVRGNSLLDKEAFRRGTSIYYADKVIPMLPPALSNGICSLNAGEDRLAFSVTMQISPEGDLLKADFAKSVICSKVRGVYTECNAILDGSAFEELKEKYAEVTEPLHLLDELTEKLEHLRKLRGALELESTESALMLDENGICIGVSAIQRGRSECIIEACMLCANEAAARYARENGIPLVYRVHEDPAPERIATLREMLVRLGKDPLHMEEVQPKDIQAILDDCREEAYFPAVNMLTLRSMAKAKYSASPLGHFGLALKDYAHFTSPIRRYPDLAVHRILTDHLAGGSTDWMMKRYGKFAENAAQQSSDTEMRAAQLEREADGCYAAEYMRSHVGETFKGVVTSVMEYGIYITLENNVEGLLHIHDFPEGEYELEDGWYLKNTLTGQEFRLGTELEVICAKADVNSGHIDLAFSVELGE